MFDGEAAGIGTNGHLKKVDLANRADVAEGRRRDRAFFDTNVLLDLVSADLREADIAETTI